MEPRQLIDLLVPRPRDVRFGPGALPMQRLSGEVELEAPGDAGPRLASWIEETVAGLAGMPMQIHAQEGPGFQVRLGKTSSPPSPARPGAGEEEAYRVRIRTDGIDADATTEVGLFRAITTVGQLLAAARTAGSDSLPEMSIDDAPAFVMRGYHEDYGRNQVPTPEDHRRTIRWLAQLKLNAFFLYIEPDHFVYTFDPDIGRENDRFEFREMRELVAYARRYHVEVIPVVELLGHVDGLLSDDRYAHLAETEKHRYAFALADPETRTLIERIVAEVVPAFESAWFHAGLDETFTVGRGRSRELVETRGKPGVYADHIRWVRDLLAGYGRRLVVYHDIVEHHPELLDDLPEDIVVMAWEYSAKPERFDKLDAIAATGRPMMALASVWDWKTLFPLYPIARANVDLLADRAAATGSIALLTSSWGDRHRFTGGYNLSELNDLPLAYAAVRMWGNDAVADEPFLRAFCAQYYGSMDMPLVEGLTELCSDRVARIGGPFRMFYGDPNEERQRLAEASPEDRAWWDGLRESAALAARLLEGIEVTTNGDRLESVRLAARMLAWSGRFAALLRDAGNGDPVAGDVEEILAERRELWPAYERVYLATNRPKNLERIRETWEWTSDRIAALVADGGK